MPDVVSVEYAHIYTNAEIATEHKLSLELLDKVKHQLNNQHLESSLVVLVDDYSFPDPTFDYDVFANWLATEGHKPNLIFRESQLIPVCDQVLRLVENDKLRAQIIAYIKAKKYPCSLFVASWYLLRLGRVAHPEFPKSLQASILINILPTSFKPFEDQALNLIKATKFAASADNIEYEFIEGRLLA